MFEYNKTYIKEQITCDCGSVFRRDCKGNHMKSEKHKKFILDKNQTA